jgi:SAM-dependent methyltransferase
MNIKEYIPALISLIKKAQNDSSLELEVILKSKITQETFDRVIKKIKGIPNITLQSSSESLDIFIENSDVRVSLLGGNSIGKYCKTNKLTELNERNILILKKSKSDSIDINNYNIRVNLKREEQKDKSEIDITQWDNKKKYFRYKKRFSYITPDKLFSFDFTILKSSNKILTTEKNYKKRKRDISSFLKQFVIKPRNRSFEEWWETLGPSDMVELMGKRKNTYKYSKTFDGSGVLENDIDYEIELEWLGNNISYKEQHEKILDILIQHTGIILQGVQKSNFIISSEEKKLVIGEYKNLMGTTRFSAPQNITLEHHHIKRHSYIDYKQLFSIRRNYSVTEKADGERNLCIILNNGEVFLLNRKNEIKPLGCSIPGLENSILDGELILKDKHNKNIILFAVFDIYFHNNTDVRGRVFNRTNEEKIEDRLDKSRDEILTDIFKKIELVFNKNTTLYFIKKQFYYGNQEKYVREQDEEITKLESELKMLDKESTLYNDIQDNIQLLKQDTLIFSEAKKVLSKEYIYKIDGLVFTPVNLVIGDELDGVPPKFDGRWNKLFKWKPPEENTIDFRVSIKQDNNIDDIKYTNLNGSVVSYKTLVLNVGYSSDKHTNVNACRVMNEDINFSREYSMVPFQPVNPYTKNIELAYLPIKNNAIFTEDRQQIKNGMIVEFSYDKRQGEGFCWKPLRIRNNNNPNDFITAVNVWRSIHFPITYEMITTGKTVDTDEDVYYFGNIDRKKLFTRPMADFHSFIKKQIISKNSKLNDKLIDFACGKGGDINHWVDSKINYVVGFDVNRDNLDNKDNGLCNRVMNMRKKNNKEILRNILVVWADSSKILSSGVAAKDDLNKYYLDIIYGNTQQELIKSSKLKKFYKMATNGFDIGSSQFSFHYFFENNVKLDTFLTNVSDSLKKGGRFVGTCLDGRKVFDLLKTLNDISVFENDKLIWKITKQYEKDIFNNDSSSIGMPIDVYVESIGNTTTEWLVNFEYLKTKSLEFGLELKNIKPFEDYFSEMKKNNIKYGEAIKMNNKLKKYSFLNTTFVFEKK